MKKIVFLAHEFGLYPGHGGVAVYLDVIVNNILETRSDYEVDVFTYVYDDMNKALTNNKFHIYKIKGNNLHEQGNDILLNLIRIKPDIVECADYLGLGLESLVYKLTSHSNELARTKFITLHHTASRECFEWNDKVDIKYANPFIQESFVRERTQMKLCDINIAPSEFMNDYISKNYDLKNVITILHPLVIGNVDVKTERKELHELYDINGFKDKFVINCISRVEGRKNQGYLIEQFIRFVKETNANSVLIIVGNQSINSVTMQSYRSEFFELIPEEFYERILFFDFMNTKEKKAIHLISDVSVLASPFECLSFAMVESVEYEVPVICSKYCGFSDYMGMTNDIMTFDPFLKNDLSNKLRLFYELTNVERSNLLKVQINEVKRLADFSNTIKNRLSLYEQHHSLYSNNDHHALLVCASNYMNIITDETINQKFDGVIITFDYDDKTKVMLNDFFLNIFDKFNGGDVVCYSCERTILSVGQAIEEKTPFVIIGVQINSELIGNTYFDVISDYIYTSKGVYTMFSKKEFEHSENAIEIRQAEKREKFKKMLMARAFINENGLSMEDKIK